MLESWYGNKLKAFPKLKELAAGPHCTFFETIKLCIYKKTEVNKNNQKYQKYNKTYNRNHFFHNKEAYFSIKNKKGIKN